MDAHGTPPAAISAVLNDDDLLSEILLRVVFPNSLVRAALVCKRWLCLAAAPAFLHRFRDLHPPHLLGFYVNTLRGNTPRFVPMPQPPELAAILGRASFHLDTSADTARFVQCCNGLLLLIYEDGRPRRTGVRCPLYPARWAATLPPVPETSAHDRSVLYRQANLAIYRTGPSDCPSYFYVATGHQVQQTIIDVYVLQDGLWTIYSSVVSEIPKIELRLPSLLGDSELLYNMAYVDNNYKLVVLDLASSSLSLVNFPEEVDHLMCARLSLADDSGVHLAHVKGFQLRIWHYNRNNNGVASWLLVDMICLREILANSAISTCMSEDAHGHNFYMHAAGRNCEIFFLEMNHVLYLFDIKHKTARKVYEITGEEGLLLSVVPFLMVWPPKFPVMKDG